ncbi:MAG: MOSC domain-containing protein [Bacteroidetes bacterium]|nr:MOSC domain-containing protein [Bacteroidota bacterium]
MNSRDASVVALSLSSERGIPKENVDRVTLVENWGISGDAHAGDWHRQVSLLAMESIESMYAKGVKVRPGAFAENITTQFITLPTLAIGSRLRIGPTLLEVTQIGKECHARCAIYYAAGDCVMPREGIFARVLEGGAISVGDPVQVCGV